MTVHPRFWSLDSIYHKLSGTRHDFLSGGDGQIYLDYLEPRGKVVLDVGASDGDSARLFIRAGAVKVIAVEKDDGMAARIRLPHVEVLNEPFDPRRHFGLPWDAAKIDIEGYEALALPYLDQIKRPMVFEVHNLHLIEEFQKQGFEFVTQPRRNPLGLSVCLMGRGRP